MKDTAARISKLSGEKRELLRRWARAQRRAVSTPAETLPRLRRRGNKQYQPFALSEFQRLLWVGRHGVCELSDCGSNVCMEFEGEGDGTKLVTRFIAAWTKVVGRHQMLRSVILRNGTQQVLPTRPMSLAFASADLRQCSAAVVEKESVRVRRRLRYGKAPINGWPLHDCVCHLIEDGRVRLHLRIDGLLVDGVSRVNVLRDLAVFLQTPDAELPPVRLSYRDYVLFEIALKDTAAYARSRHFWTERVARAPQALRFPMGRSSSVVDNSGFVIDTDTAVDSGRWEGFTRAAAAHRVSPSSVLIAALCRSLGSVGRMPEFSIGLLDTRRLPIDDDIMEVVGNFNTLVPLTYGTAVGGPFEQARDIQSQVHESADHKYYFGYSLLRDYNRVTGSIRRAALPVIVNCMVDYRPDEGPWRSGVKVGTESVVRLVGGTGCAPQVLMMVTLYLSSQRTLVCRWQFRAGMLEPELVQEVRAEFARLIRQLASEAPTSPADRLAEGERRESGRNGAVGGTGKGGGRRLRAWWEEWKAGFLRDGRSG